MDDPLGVTANVIGVVTAACQTCKALSDLISSFINAPEHLTKLHDDLITLQALIESLKWAVSPDPARRLSLEQISCMSELIPAMRSCETACDVFKQRLSKATSRSPQGLLSLVDRARWPFNEKDIAVLQSRLSDCKQTMSVALGVVTLNTMASNQEEFRNFEAQVATTTSSFIGKLQGIELAIQAMTPTTECQISRSDVFQVVELLNEQHVLLKQCLKVCTLGLNQTTEKGGTTVRYANALQEANQFIGNIGAVGSGGPRTEVESATATGQARQMIGNMDGASSRYFFERAPKNSSST